MGLIKNVQPFVEMLVSPSLMVTWLEIESRAHSGILSLALLLIKIPSAKATLNELKANKRIIKLNHRQKNKLAALALRLGVTRKIKIAWTDNEVRKAMSFSGSFNNPRFTDEDTLMVSGTNWPDRYPAIIYIRSSKILASLDSYASTSSYTTKILHEIAHIKRRDGRNLRKRLFVGLCANVASIALGYLAGKKSVVEIGLLNGTMLGIGAGVIAGSVLSNIIMGLITLKVEQKTEEMAVRASTVEELTTHIFGELLCVKYEKPYWKLIFQPSSLWSDPPSVNVKK